MKLLLCLLFLQFVSHVKANVDSKSVEAVKKYLLNYNYWIKKDENPFIAHDSPISDMDSFREALETLQRRFGLKVTGRVNQETIDLINSPRCGFPDKDSSFNKKSPNAFTLNSEKWRKVNISYRIIDYSKKLNRNDIDKNLDRAFKLWGKHIPLNFRHCSGCHSVDIQIRFANKSHNDDYPFDGPGRVLAHAFAPEVGDIHFDDEEDWTFNEPTGVNFYQAAVHEIGHSLGLLHSENNNAVMAPKYNGYKENFDLHEDDIKGIQALYPYNSEDGDQKPNKCGSSFIITATASTDDGHRFFFGEKWVVIVFKNASMKTERIQDIFKGFEDDRVDSAAYFSTKQYPYYQITKLMVLFSKSRVYKYERGLALDFFKDSGYPRETKKDFAIITQRAGVEEFGAILTINRTLIFFRDNYFWEVEDDTVSQRKSIKDTWKNVPYPIDAAMNYEFNGKHFYYFFKNKGYVRFNMETKAVQKDSTNPYPRSSQKLWFSCSNVGPYEETNAARAMSANFTKHFLILSLYFLFKICFL